jgi:D-sedoheptulose 7-phosphate isomerase
MKDKIERIIKDSIKAKEDLLATQVANIEKAAWAIINCLKGGGKILIFGNGGSAADSQHMAAELVGRFKKERKALAAIALTANTSTITAIGNDYGYDAVFSRQVEALGKMGDIALGISTSGNSPNVLGALERAKLMGLETIAITGGGGGKLKNACGILIVAGSKDTPRIQEAHIAIIHALCELIEDEITK